MWLAFACLSVLLINGCASHAEGPAANPAAGLQIRGLIIENQTKMWVSTARLLVPATGGFVSCGTINPQSFCATTFPERSYSGNTVEISWTQGQQMYSSGKFELELPDGIDIDRPARVRVIISAPGSAGAIIVQDKESRQ